jgi:WD40 repeat protein
MKKRLPNWALFEED